MVKIIPIVSNGFTKIVTIEIDASVMTASKRFERIKNQTCKVRVLANAVRLHAMIGAL